MNRGRIVVVILALSFVFGGCAFTQASLKVGYGAENVRKGPLSSVRPLRVEIGEFLDKRPEQGRIGYKRNLYGANTADIVTTQPVPQIVREAFMVEFSKNGHIIGTDNKEIVLSGTITSFWFDLQMNFFTVEFMGTVALEINVVNGKTGTILLTRSYQDHYNEKSMGGLDATWERVMNTALERVMHQIGTDNTVIQALKSL